MQVNLLGPVEIRHCGVPLPIPGEKLRTIVAVLSLRQNRPVPRDEVAELGLEPGEALTATLQAILQHRAGRLHQGAVR